MNSTSPPVSKTGRCKSRKITKDVLCRRVYHLHSKLTRASKLTPDQHNAGKPRSASCMHKRSNLGICLIVQFTLNKLLNNFGLISASPDETMGAAQVKPWERKGPQNALLVW